MIRGKYQNLRRTSHVLVGTGNCPILAPGAGIVPGLASDTCISLGRIKAATVYIVVAFSYGKVLTSTLVYPEGRSQGLKAPLVNPGPRSSRSNTAILGFHVT